MSSCPPACRSGSTRWTRSHAARGISWSGWRPCAHFEQVHPFLDGNGRTGRLALNLVLARLGYPPAIYRFVVPALAGPARLVPLAALVGPDISMHALRAAARRGRLEAVRGADGQWRSSRLWVDAYLARRWSKTRLTGSVHASTAPAAEKESE